MHYKLNGGWKMEISKIISPNAFFSFEVAPEQDSARLDVFITQQFPDYSRNFFRTLIEHDCITINNLVPKKCGVKLKTGDTIAIKFPEKREPQSYDAKDLKNLNIEIVFEHPDFLVLYKPAGVIVHPPSEKSEMISLIDWLLATYKDIKHVGYTTRPGIVHRLDKDTSGLLIVALNNVSHAKISDMFKSRTIHKTYYAVVSGHPLKEGSIDFPIGRHPVTRSRMTHNATGRSALTYYKVIEYFEDSSLVEIKLITGRTHQIRVHFSTIGHPLIGDALYGTPSKKINRQALHAHSLQFDYEGNSYSFTKELPKDFQSLIKSKKLL